MILIIQVKLPHYRIPFFVELHKRLPCKVLYSELENVNGETVEHEIFIKVPIVKLPAFLGGFYYQSIKGHIKRLEPERVIFEYSNFNLTLFDHLLRSKHKPVLWGHGYNRQDKQGHKGISIWLKRFCGNRSHSIITYSEGGKQFLASLGIDSNRIFVAWNSIKREEPVYSKELSRQKFKNRKIGFIGRLIPEKGIDALLETFKILNQDSSISFEVIGGGEKLNYYQQRYGFVHFHGPLNSMKEINSILMQCSVLISPGYLGLNVVDALNNLLPIVAPQDGINGIYHSPEYEYVKDEACLILVKEYTSLQFAHRILNLLSDFHKYDQTVKSVKLVSTSVSLERMVAGFIACLKFELGKDEITGPL